MLVLSRGWAGSGLCFSKIHLPSLWRVNRKEQDVCREMREELRGEVWSKERDAQMAESSGLWKCLVLVGVVGGKFWEDAGVHLEFPPEPASSPVKWDHRAFLGTEITG